MDGRKAGRTDWTRLDRQSEDETNDQAASDPDAAPLVTEEWLAKAELITPNKRPISIRLDAEVLEYFQKKGKNYQTRINQVLRAYVEAHKKSA